MAGVELILDDTTIYIEERSNGGVIWRGIGALDEGNPKIKTLSETLDETWVFFLQTQTG